MVVLSFTLLLVCVVIVVCVGGVSARLPDVPCLVVLACGRIRSVPALLQPLTRAPCYWLGVLTVTVLVVLLVPLDSPSVALLFSALLMVALCLLSVVGKALEALMALLHVKLVLSSLPVS